MPVFRPTLRKLSSRTLPWPVDWSALFGNNHPLILEIGFGRGVFLYHLARTYPDHNVIGLEISNKSLTSAERTVERLPITNIRIIQSSAETALHHLFTPATLSQVHINFPDPWFKIRHRGRRLMQRDTLNALVNRMKPGATLYLATDILDYAQMSSELLAATPELDNMLDIPWANSMAGRVTTKYEAAAQRAGRACYYFAYRRNNQPAPAIPAVKEVPVPHAVLETPLSLDDIRAAFVPADHTYGETVVSLIECFRGQWTLLFDVFVKEPTIDQRITVILRSRPGGDFTLMLGPIGQPRPTEGVHRAVLTVAEWLTSIHPDARITSLSTQDDDL